MGLGRNSAAPRGSSLRSMRGASSDNPHAHGPHAQVGAGTMNPATFLRVLGPEPWKVAYVEPSIRPDDSRYGLNPNRVQRHTQFQARASEAGPTAGLRVHVLRPAAAWKGGEVAAGDALTVCPICRWHRRARCAHPPPLNSSTTTTLKNPKSGHFEAGSMQCPGAVPGIPARAGRRHPEA